MSSPRRWDPFGRRWGRDSHWPLMLNIGTHSQRSDAAKKQRQKNAKNRRKAHARESQKWLAEFSASFGNPRGSGREEDAVLAPPTLQWFLKRRNLPPAAVRAGDAAYDSTLLKQRAKIFEDALAVCEKHQRGTQIPRHMSA